MNDKSLITFPKIVPIAHAHVQFSMGRLYLKSTSRIVVTNDGHAILRELDLAHPAARSMIELSRTQDEEVGDGTSVIVLAGEMLHVAEAFIEKNYHPTVICRGSNSIDVNDLKFLCATTLGLVKSCIGTKFTSQFGDLIADLAIDATTIVGVDLGQGLREVDINKYIKVEVMFNKDVVAPGMMKRKIVNPHIIFLDCPLEYKKVLLKMEEEYIKNMCMQILKFKPDLIITEKGLSDLACHYLSQVGVSAIRRLRKTNNKRNAKACGAVIVNRPDELQESDVGTGAGLFKIRKIGDEFFAFKHDQESKLVPGGGATELTVSARQKQKSSSIEGIEMWPYEAAAIAFEAIPRTLAQTMTHANGENAWTGIDGNTSEISDMKEEGMLIWLHIWDAYNVKSQTFKTAIEAACMLLRMDDIVSGIKKKQAPRAGATKPNFETEANSDGEQRLPG
ncbi:hypothetical protein K2173_016708 [Erythroxylum novogranatense]|uniref:T-complex protein 1 subunit gamma n=1 Tax=Erythroxylum novogranatense TaxID=1862640 RepID=A0AAV8SGZ7_9ROSI|nr:hypothetical protein K2173_016708 [Erythroxylum novogranatense]